MGDGKLLRNFKEECHGFDFYVLSTIGHRLMGELTSSHGSLVDAVLCPWPWTRVSPRLLRVLPADVSQLSPSQKTGWRRAACPGPKGMWRLSSSLGQLWRAVPATRLCGIHWHPCCGHITAQLLLLPNFTSFTPLLVMFPRALPRKPPTDMFPSQSLFCVDLNPATLFPNLESWGACYSFLGSPLPLQVFMSKQQCLGLLHTLFWEVSDSYQDTKIFLQALLQTAGESRDDPSLASLSLQWEARAHFSSSYMRRRTFVAVSNWT